MAKQVRRLNKRFVMLLTIGIMMVVLIIVALIIVSTATRDPQIYAQRADAALAKGDYREAAKNYQKAYTCSKRDPAWLIKVAEALYEIPDERGAVAHLHRAVVADPTLVSAQKRLVEIYFNLIGRENQVSQMKALEEEADRLIKMIPENKIEQEPELKKALALGYHCRGVARYGRRTEDAGLAKQALADIDRALALESNPEFVKSLVMIRLGEASQMVRAARSEGVTLTAYDEYIKAMRDKIRTAETLYLDVAKRAKDDPEAYVSLGNFYFQIWGGTELSQAAYCRIQRERLANLIQQQGRQLESLAESTTVSAEEKRRARQRASRQRVEWEQAIPDWDKRSRDHETLGKRLTDQARTYYDQAIALADAKKTETEKAAARLALANYEMASQHLTAAEKLAREAVQLDPKGFAAYRMLSQILRAEAQKEKDKAAAAKTQEAIQVLARRVYEIPTQLEGFKGRQNRFHRLELILDLVEAYLNRNSKDDLKAIDQGLKELSDSEYGEIPRVYLLKARRAMAANDVNESLKLLEKADRQAHERDPQVKLLLAQLYMNTNAVGAAKKEVDAALALAPDNAVTWRMAASIYLQAGEAAGALDFASRVLAQEGSKGDTGLLRVKLEALARLNRLTEADETAKALAAAGVDLNWPVQKARLLLAQGQNKAAEDLLTRTLKDRPGDKTATLYLTDLYVNQNRLSDAQTLVDAALAKNPKDKELTIAREVVAIKDPAKRSARLTALTQELMADSMARGLTQAQEEKDPFVRAVRLVDQYLRRNDFDNATRYVDEAVKLDPKRANPLNFRIGLIRRQWDRAEKARDLARLENLDSLKGLTYEAELANARGWDLLNSAPAGDEAGQEAARTSAQTFFEASAKAASQILRELPNDAQAHALLADAYFWMDRRNDALLEVAKAMDLSPSNPYALRSASLQQWEEIRTKGASVPAELVQAFAQNVRNAAQQMPWDRWLKDKAAFLAQERARQQEYREDVQGDVKAVLAKREARKKTNPADVENLIRLALLYEGVLNKDHASIRDLDRAERYYQEVLTLDPRGDRLRAAVEFAQRTKRTQSLETFLTGFAAKQAASGKADGYSLLGLFYMQTGTPAKAETPLLEAVKVEDTAARRLDVAAYYTRVAKPEKTVEWCDKVLSAKPTRTQHLSAQSLMIEALLTLNRWDDAKRRITEYQQLDNGTEGRIFQARLAVGQGQLSEAERILTDLVNANPDNPTALNYRSTVYLYLWRLQDARADLERIQKVSPGGSDVAGRIKLIKLNCELGQTREAERQTRDLINRAADQSPDLIEAIRQELLPPLASALTEKDYTELLVWASNRTNQFWGWSYEQGRFYTVRGKYEDAVLAFRRTWQTLETMPKASVELKMMVLDTYLDAIAKTQDPGRYDRIIQIAESARTGMPQTSSRLLVWQAAAYYARDQKTKGQAALRQALSTGGSVLEVWQAMRTIMLPAVRAKDLAQDLETLRQTLTTEPGRTVASIALATCFFAADDVEKGAGLLRQDIDAAKDPRQKTLLLYILGQEYTDKRKHTDALATLMQAKQLDEGNVAVLNNLAYILEEYLGRAQEAIPYIQEAFRKAPNNPDVLDTYGQTLFKTGKDEEALFNVAKSVWIRESSASRYHLGVILNKKGRSADAGLQLRRALQLVGDDKVLENQIRQELNKGSR